MINKYLFKIIRNLNHQLYKYLYSCRTLLLIMSYVMIGNQCSVFKAKTPLDKENIESYRICFWNVNHSKMGLDSPGILPWIDSCDTISFLQISPEDKNLVTSLEKLFEKKGISLICMENNPQHKESVSLEKYVICTKSDLSVDIEKIEFEEMNPSFPNAPPLFLMNLHDKKIMVVPFHSRPGNKKDLMNFNSVVDFAYKNFSDRRIFFGGDFYTDPAYQKIEYLVTVPFYLILEELIHEPTTHSNQKNDVIFTDPRTAKQCKGNVWRLQELYPQRISKSELERFSDHLPISVDCLFK